MTRRRIKQTFYTTKKLFQKALKRLKTFLPQRQKKQPEAHLQKPLLSREQTNSDEKCSCRKNTKSPAEKKGVKGLKEEKKKVTYSVVKQEESGFLAVHELARKMNDLEMMDLNGDQDHALDLEELFYYYSLITCPAYLEVVDRFFMDMYSEFMVPVLSRTVSSSMRKLGSASDHGSRRKLGGLAGAHGSMRSLGPLKL